MIDIKHSTLKRCPSFFSENLSLRTARLNPLTLFYSDRLKTNVSFHLTLNALTLRKYNSTKNS